ncbi:MAG: glycosyltransferase family 1 protein [Deltaproteobacteria bacterium]|nr:glycosyltransferase family 1 protein [Deltaproteobacteria bacterium]
MSAHPDGLRVLLVVHDRRTWKNARSIAYTSGWAYEDALRGLGARVTCITTPWSAQLPDVLGREKFDQIWIQLLHATSLRDEFFHWMTEAAPIRVGFLQESLEYDESHTAMRAGFPGGEWKARVKERSRCMTHMVAIDEADAVSIPAEDGIPALWWPQAVPERFVCRDIPPANDKRGVFVGRLYNVRAEMLEQPGIREHVWVRKSLESRTLYPTLFNTVHGTTRLLSRMGAGRALLPGYVSAVRHIREKVFALWLDTLRGGASVVSLPHTVHAYPGRVVEAMAAGRPVIAWRVPGRPRCTELFEDGREILFYDREHPEQIIAHIERVAGDPGYARLIAERARAKVLEFHTSEKSAAQILDWIDCGKEPVYS